MQRFTTHVAVLGLVFALGTRFGDGKNVECESLKIVGCPQGSIEIGPSSNGLLIRVFETGRSTPRCAVGLFEDGRPGDPTPGVRLFDRKGDLALSCSLAPLARGGELAQLELWDGTHRLVDLSGTIRQGNGSFSTRDPQLLLVAREATATDGADRQSFAATCYTPDGVKSRTVGEPVRPVR